MKKIQMIISQIMGKQFLAVVCLSLILFPIVTSAASGLTLPDHPTGLPGSDTTKASSVILTLIGYALAVVGIIAVIFLIIGGFRYITSAGNEQAAESAKKTILNAVIGLVIIIFSYVIIVVIINALANGQV